MYISFLLTFFSRGWLVNVEIVRRGHLGFEFDAVEIDEWVFLVDVVGKRQADLDGNLRLEVEYELQALACDDDLILEFEEDDVS